MAMSLVIAVSSMLVCAGCSRVETKDEVMERLIQGANEDKKVIIVESEGLYDNYRAYRDETNDSTVVVEFTLAQGQTAPNVDPARLRSDLIDIHRNDPNMVEIIKTGINIRNVYQTFEGNVYLEFTVTEKDLE